MTIINRIKSWYDKTLMDQQQGFRSGRGTSDGIYITKRIQQITDSIEKPIFVLFVNLSSAFDHVAREWLFKSIFQRAMPNKPTKLFDILKAIYSFTTTALSETPNDSFKINYVKVVQNPRFYTTYTWIMFWEYIEMNVTPGK